MKKHMRAFLSALLTVSVLASCAALPVRAAGAGAKPDLSPAGFFDGLYDALADVIDRLRLACRKPGVQETRVERDAFTLLARGCACTDDGGFRIDSGFSADVYGMNRPFHRMTFLYASDEPLQLRVTYKAGFRKITTLYYLEAADDGCFRCLIEPYLSGGTARKLVSLAVQTCTGNTADFALRDIRTERLRKLRDPECFLENDRFRLGVKLGWGGGIHYFADKRTPVEGLGNLINQHDTGRLVQQSYYGTGPIEGVYDPGVAFDVTWRYNPVQGGDQFGNAGRLIDFEVGENTVYVKAQPQDWARDNGLTPSYAENTYTLCGSFVRVDNRFVDFSGWEHPYVDQELPAFYTVSFLSRFTRYDGTNPWQDDALTHRDDLPFWGTYAAACTFPYKTGNTETWCAWSSPESGFGVGLYVPNVDVLKAGRYAFNGSKDPMDEATNYVAPLNVIRLTPYCPIEYSYLLTTGSLTQIRETFKENKDFANNASLHENYISGRVG